MVMGSRMQHGSAQPTAAHALQGKRNARVVGCDEDNRLFVVFSTSPDAGLLPPSNCFVLSG